MSIKAKISDDLKDAMRARDKNKLDALRLIMAAIKQIEVDERIEIDDNRLMLILEKLAKQRNESITQFKAANRNDLVVKEEYELNLINHYLPPQISDTEIELVVTEAFKATNAQVIADMGKVMAHVKATIQGRADMSKISALIKSRLGTVK